ncbi:hypothetical protein Lser_V15G10627 [Lactuca serriola]
MKLNGLTFFLVVLSAFILFSAAGRTHPVTLQPQNNKQKAIESEKVAHTNSGPSTWGGCWSCWKNHDRRLLR